MMDSVKNDDEFDETIWKVIDTFFSDNPQSLVRHHIDSYNDFTKDGISQLFREINPRKVDLEYNIAEHNFGSSAKLYFGGKDGKRVFYGKPVIYDTPDNTHFMFPNEARLRNMTYSMPVYCDIDIDIERVVDPTADIMSIDGPTAVDEHGFKTTFDPTTKRTDREIANVTNSISSRGNQRVQRFKMPAMHRFICNLPIMVQSNRCILHGLDRQGKHALGECKNDLGGYFIIDGKEKTVVCQELFGNNMLYVQKNNKPDDAYLYTAKIRSVSENVSKPVRTIAVHLANPSSKYTNYNILVDVPNVRKPVPLFILFRALGIISDKSIIATCMLKDPSTLDAETVDWFLPSIHDSGEIHSQNDALVYLSRLVKGKSVNRVLYILADLFLPHVGEINFTDKAYYLGYIVNEMFAVASGAKDPTDRDNYKYKRVEPVGVLLRDLFREYFITFATNVGRGFETKYEFNKASYADISTLIELTQDEVFTTFGKNWVDVGIQKAFKGSWGGTPKTKRVGVVQDLNRLSYLGYISHLRKTNLPLDASVKLIGPRILHGSQWGIIDAIDTPDGGNIGIHKYLAITTYVTRSHSREPLIHWIRQQTEEIGLVPLSDVTPLQLGEMVKIMVNGFWAGSVYDPIRAAKYMRECRRQGLLPASTSIAFDIPAKTILIFNDGGRLCRPIFYRDETTKEFPFHSADWKRIKDADNIPTWTELISGFYPKKHASYDPMQSTIYEWEDLYTVGRSGHMGNRKAILEYIDTSESEYTKIAINSAAMNMVSSYEAKRFTHHELHESTGYGVMCNLINFLEHNPVVRNSFSCGQSKQACSVYHTNYDLRMDKTAVVLNNGQNPLVKSRYLEHITHEENPYGVNAIVAIMCYTGYNVEDAILVNEGALQRGLFRTTYYSTYEAHEEKTVKGDTTHLKTFANIDQLIAEKAIVGTKPNYDYSQLDADGLVHENIPVSEKTVLIGLTSGMVTSITATGNAETSNAPGSTAMNNAMHVPTGQPRRDASKSAKKGQMGVVDRAFMTDGAEGQRIAKVRLREERIPAVGDKMASRAGQKGTIGNIVPERDMPFTADGVRPDLIVNPHALPSRMTLGQLVECLAAKAVAHYGMYADCTAFANLRRNAKAFFGALLSKIGFHSTGDEIMYNGMTGEQIKCSIFIGPTYYMRLKHMVKDKINFRARGPNANMTRQPVGGRANDGGLRIGEMERDSILAHGTSEFLQDSMMERGDKYHMAVCNTTGTIAVYNPTERLMYSLAADGPVKYSGSLTEGDDSVRIQQITKYGRSFSIVEIPYSLKLLIQELQTIGVRMHLITDDNVSQLDNLTGSVNTNLLTGLTPQGIADAVRKKLHHQAEHQSSAANRRLNHEQHKFHNQRQYATLEPPLLGGNNLNNLTKQSNNPPNNLTDLPDNNLTDLPDNNITELPDYLTNLSNNIPNNLTELPDNLIDVTDDFNLPKVANDYSHLTTSTELPMVRLPVVDDIVHFRGDNISHRLWKVTHGGNHNDITIATQDARNLNTEDTILRVKGTDVYYPELGNVYAAPVQSMINPAYAMQPPIGYEHEMFGHSGMGGPIHFAPVVKIFNGGGVDGNSENKVGGTRNDGGGSSLDFNSVVKMGESKKNDLTSSNIVVTKSNN